MKIAIPDGRCFTSRPVNCCCPWFAVAWVDGTGKIVGPSCRWCQQPVKDGNRPDDCPLYGGILIEVDMKAKGVP
jgi:hypothetical protein